MSLNQNWELKIDKIIFKKLSRLPKKIKIHPPKNGLQFLSSYGIRKIKKKPCGSLT